MRERGFLRKKSFVRAMERSARERERERERESVNNRVQGWTEKSERVKMSICMFVQLRKAIKCIYLPTYVQTNKE